MEILKAIFIGLCNGAFGVTAILLYLSPLEVFFFVRDRIKEVPATPKSVGLLALWVVEGTWWYSKEVFNCTVPPWLDVLGQIGAFGIAVWLVLDLIIDMGRDIRNAKKEDERKKAEEESEEDDDDDYDDDSDDDSEVEDDEEDK